MMEKPPSLPPGVAGAATGEVVFRVGGLDWSGVPPRQVPRLPYVAIKWWGDPGPGVMISASRGESISFPVCCSPRYLVRYLQDMTTLNLTLIEFTSNEALGTVAVDVRYLNVSTAIHGSFPVASLTGQHIASLDLDIELVFFPLDSTVSSFEAAEHKAALGLPLAQTNQPNQLTSTSTFQHSGSSSDQPTLTRSTTITGDDTLVTQDTAQHSMDWETSLEQLDLFEVLHNRLSRNVDAFYMVFRMWECSDTHKTIRSLLTLLKKHRVLQYRMTPQQWLYLELIMDPLGDMPLDLDNILQAMRHAQEAGLRVRTAQLDPVIPQLQPLFKALEQRNIALRAMFRDAEPAGEAGEAGGQVRGVLQLRQLVDWMRAALPTDLTTNELIRYLLILIIHVGESPLGRVTYQDLQIVGQLVMDHSRATGRILEPLAQPIMREDIGTPGGSTNRQTALMKLKNRTSRPVRPAGNQQQTVTDHQHLLPPQVNAPTYGPRIGLATDDVVQGEGRTLDQKRQRLQPAAGLLPPEHQFQDVPTNSLALIQHAAQVSSGLTVKEQGGPVRVPVAGGVAGVQPGSLTDRPLGLQWDAATHSGADGADGHEVQPAPDKDASSPGVSSPAGQEHQAGGSGGDDNTDVLAFIQQASDLQRELARRIDQARSAGTSPARGSRVPGSKLTAESLAVLSSAPPDVLLDLLHGSPAGSPRDSPRAAVKKRQWGDAGDLSTSSSPHSYSKMRHVTGLGFQSPTGHSSSSVSPYEYDKHRRAYHVRGGGHGGSDDSDTDEEGAASFAEQQLLQQLFYHSVDPQGAAHVTRVVSPSGVLRQHGDGSQGPDDVAAHMQPPETPQDASPTHSNGAGDPASPGARQQLGVAVHVKGIALGFMPRQSLQAYIHSGDMQLVLKVRSSCSPSHHLAVLPPAMLLDPTALDSGENSHPGLQLLLPAIPPEDPLTSPPVRVFMEVWQLPGSCASPAMSGSPASTPRHLGYLGQAASALAAASDAEAVKVDALEAALSNANGAHLVGVAEATLDTLDAVQGSASNVQTATAAGQFPVMDLLGSETPLGHVKLVSELVGGWGPLLRHTWRVTLCGAAGLPDADGMAAAGLPVPVARFAKYLYPGEAAALVTEEVPPADCPIFAATALHSVVLPTYARPSLGVLLGEVAGEAGGQQQQADLVFEVWDKWVSGPDTCVGTTTIPLTQLLSLTPGDVTSLTLPLTLHPNAAEAVAAQARHVPSSSPAAPPPTKPTAMPGAAPSANHSHSNSQPVSNLLGLPSLEIRIQSECIVVGHCTFEPSPPPSPGPTSPRAPDNPLPHSAQQPQPPELSYADVAVAGTRQHQLNLGSTPTAPDSSSSPPRSPRPAHLPPAAPVQARLSIDVVAACGLQAAVQEASAWLGGGSAVLGKAMQLGPHPYVTLNLFPADTRLAKRLPALRTPFQAQSFCPRYDWHAEVDLTLDTPTLTALFTQQMCVEVWHHPSRSLAALMAQQQQQQGEAARGGRAARGREAPAAGQDMLLGSGTCGLDKLLLRPNGVQGWVIIRSARGVPVGAVQLAARISHVGTTPIDTCMAALPPLDSPHDLAALLPPDLPKPVVELDAFQGQWARCTAYIEQASLTPHQGTGSAAAVRQANNRNYVYYVTYTLPGSDSEVNSVAKAATADRHPAPPPGPSFSKGLAPPTPHATHIPLQHVAVHWVRADARLAGALARSPLRLQLWRALERATTLPSASTPSPPSKQPALSSAPWVSTQCLGSVEIDLSQLVVKPLGSKQLPARWASGTYLLIDPAATCYTSAHVRVKFLLELSPPSNPPTTAVLAAGSWQPGDEYAAAVATPPSQQPAQPQDEGKEQQAGSGLPPPNSDTCTYSPGPASDAPSPVPGSPGGGGQVAGVQGVSTPIGGAQQPGSQGLVAPGQGLPSAGVDMFSIARISPVPGQPGAASFSAAHPVLGVSKVTSPGLQPSVSNTTPSDQVPSSAVAPGSQQVQLVSVGSQEEQFTALSRGSSDAAERLRQQLQELDVLSLQWGRKLRQQDLQEQILSGLLQHGPGAVTHLRGVSRQASPPSEPSHTTGSLHQGQPPYHVLQPPASTDVAMDATVGRQLATAVVPLTPQLPPQVLAAPGHNAQQAQPSAFAPADVAVAGIAAAAGGGGGGGYVVHGEGWRAGAARSVVDAQPGLDEVQARTGVWVSTVSTLVSGQQQAQRQSGALANLEVCSDDGGDMVFGGYSASEADTDELMANIAVSYAVHEGPSASGVRAGGGGGNQGSVAAAARAFDPESLSPPKDEDWMFTFARSETRTQATRSMTVPHPGMTHVPVQAAHPAPHPGMTHVPVQAVHPATAVLLAPAPGVTGATHFTAPSVAQAPGVASQSQPAEAAAAEQQGSGTGGAGGVSLQARLDSLLAGFQAHVSGMVASRMGGPRHRRLDSDDEDAVLPERTALHVEDGPAPRVVFGNSLPPLQPDFELRFSDAGP